MTDLTITTDLALPRNGDHDVPADWVNDATITLGALVLLGAIVPCVQPGRIATGADLRYGPKAEHVPLADLIGELVDAGYLIPDGPDRYRLVHPDRFPPLAQVRTR